MELTRFALTLSGNNGSTTSATLPIKVEVFDRDGEEQGSSLSNATATIRNPSAGEPEAALAGKFSPPRYERGEKPMNNLPFVEIHVAG